MSKFVVGEKVICIRDNNASYIDIGERFTVLANRTFMGDPRIEIRTRTGTREYSITRFSRARPNNEERVAMRMEELELTNPQEIA